MDKFVTIIDSPVSYFHSCMLILAAVVT
jgi:hypothetical protein